MMILAVVTVLAGCGKSELAAPNTVESLAANPERLKELLRQGKLDRAKLGDSLCNRVTEARNRRFLNDGPPYAPSKELP